MNATPTIQTPERAANLGDNPYHKVFVTLALPPLPGIFPEGNLISTIAVAQLLKAELALEGVLVNSCGHSGELNRSLYLLDVDHPRRAFPILESTLRRAHLLYIAKIGWVVDGSARLVYPGAGEIEFPFAQIEQDKLQLAEVEKVFLSMMQQLGLSPSEDWNPS